MQKEVLIVGGDDSNHSGSAKGELNVATFSFLYRDSLVKQFSNNRNREGLMYWLKDAERDYRFAMLASERYRHSSSNLIVTVPKLIKLFFEDNDLKVRELKIYLDGIIGKYDKENLKKLFMHYRGIEEVVIGNFIKKRKGKHGEIIKRPNCPSVVYYADVLANYLFSTKTFEELTSSNECCLVL